MKLSKHLFYSSGKQIWRLIISDTEKLIIENRDMKSKEVFFNCFDLNSAEKIFKDFQLDDKHWVGIDAVYNNVIYFHKFPKPDMPSHKEIIALDVSTQEILWTNEDLTFSFVHNEKVYGFTQGFEDRHFRALDYRTGVLLDDLQTDNAKINSIRSAAEKQIDWSVYSYPGKFSGDDERKKSIIDKYIGKSKTEGDVEFAISKDLLLFNFHTVNNDNLFTNNFYAIDINSEKIILNETLNKNAPSLFNDSFFIYKNFLFLLKEKNEVLIFTME